MVVSAVAPQNFFVFRNSSDKQVEADRPKLLIGKAEIHPSKQHSQLSKKKTRLITHLTYKPSIIVIFSGLQNWKNCRTIIKPKWLEIDINQDCNRSCIGNWMDFLIITSTWKMNKSNQLLCSCTLYWVIFCTRFGGRRLSETFPLLPSCGQNM